MENFWVFFKDKFVKVEEAKISIITNALQYGTSVFGGIRGYYNENKKAIFVFRIQDHYKRFLNSLKILGVSIKYNQKELEKITIELIKKNKPKQNVYIRPFSYAGSLNLAPNLNKDRDFDFALYMLSLDDYLPIDKGLKVCVSSWRRISDDSLPPRGKFSGAYLSSALINKEARDLGFDEAIVLNENGHISEGSAENLFIVRDGVLITSPVYEDILEGITRKTVLELAKDFKIPTEIRPIDRTELYICDEAFFTGTGVQIAWISEVDKRQIGFGKRGKITAKIQDTFFKIVYGNHPKYSAKWCSKVLV
jgi:branched-chain amino acid aminotransferase